MVHYKWKIIILLTILAIANMARSQSHRIDSIRNVAIAHPGDTLGVLSRIELCYEFRFINQDTAIRHGEDAIALAKVLKYETGLAQAESDLGVVYYDRGEFRKAMENWKSALAIRTATGDSLKMAPLFLKIGSLLFKQGRYEESLVNQLNALTIYTKKHSDNGASYALNNIAAVYEHQHQLDKALEYYLQSFAIKEKVKDDYQTGLTQINIANIYYQKKQYDEATHLFRDAIAKLKKYSYASDYLAIGYNNLSDVFSTLQKFDSALVYGNKALELRRSIKDYQGVVSSLNNLGSISLNLDRFDQASRYLNAALDSANARNLPFEKEKIYLNFYKLYSRQGNQAKALENYIRYSEMKDSLLNEASQKNINELQINYETESRERELSEQKALFATGQLELQRSRTQLIILAAAVLLLLVTGVLIYQFQRSRRKKMEQEAMFKLQLAEAKLENELQQDRLRISRELHDNIGSRLLFLSTAATNLSEATPGSKATQLGEFAKNTLHELRRTVWLINRDSVSLEELEVKMREYFSFIDEASRLKIIIRTSGNTTNSIRSQKAAAIFRVAQEAVSNGIKHSGADRIEISLTQTSGNMLQIMISDNGKGFDINSISAGNGLNNMRAHVVTGKGTIRIVSVPGSGTTIDATLPLE